MKFLFSKSENSDSSRVFNVAGFRNFIAARVFLTIAIQIQFVVVSWEIFEATHDPLSLGLIGLSEAIPFIAIALFGGHLADVVDRKKIALACTSVLLLSVLALMVISWSGISNKELWPLYGIVVITGIARGFLAPALPAYMGQMMPRELLSVASAWNSTFWHIAAVCGPALGGLIYGFGGATVAYSSTFVFMLISVVLMLSLPFLGLPKKMVKESIGESLKNGLRFVFTNQMILGAMSLDLFAVFFGGAVAMLPMFASDVLHVGKVGFGFLRAAPATGAIIMAIVLAFKPVTVNAGRKLFLNVAAFGLCMIMFALSKNIILSFVILAISGAVDNVSVVIRSTILQLMTPDEMRGRVMSVNSIFIGSSNEIGEMESGIAAKLMGLIPSVIFGGCMTILSVGAVYKLSPKLRELDLTIRNKEEN